MTTFGEQEKEFIADVTEDVDSFVAQQQQKIADVLAEIGIARTHPIFKKIAKDGFITNADAIKLLGNRGEAATVKLKKLTGRNIIGWTPLRTLVFQTRAAEVFFELKSIHQ